MRPEIGSSAGKGNRRTFNFLGFTHFCGQRHKTETFTVWRITAKKRMVAKLKAIKAELRRRKHDRTSQVGVWLRSVVTGYYQYHAVPGNLDQLRLFQKRVKRLWHNVLVRRSQRARKKWESFAPVFDRWVPTTSRSAPLSSCPLLRHSSFIRAVCVDAHVRICPGGAQRGSSLPGQLLFERAPGLRIRTWGIHFFVFSSAWKIGVLWYPKLRKQREGWAPARWRQEESGPTAK